MVGRIYANTDDLNIFIKRKGLCSWTMNLGNIWSWIITGAVITVVMAVQYLLKRI